ncbi:MAG: hypothetical protein RR620_13095 [Clostridium sp.]
MAKESKDPNKKRASLYFNLLDQEEKLIWEHLEQRKTSQYIKRLILNDINNNGQVVVTGVPIQVPSVEQKNEDREIESVSSDENEELDIDEIDFENL